MSQQTFTGLIKFVGTLAAYQAKQAEGKLIFAQITDQPANASVSAMTGSEGDIEYRIYANGVDYILPNRAAFKNAVENLRVAANINVEALTGTTGQTLINAGTLQAVLNELAQEVDANQKAGVITVESSGITEDIVYIIKQGGNDVGHINIPRDQFLKDAEIVHGHFDPDTHEFVPDNNFSGEHSASADSRTFIHFTFVVRDTTGETHSYGEKHVYLDATDLIDVYAGLEDKAGTADSAKTEDILVHVDANNKIYAEIRPNGALETRINNAISALAQAQELSSANKGIEITSAATGTTLALKIASTTIEDIASAETEASYLAVDGNDGSKALRINEAKVEHAIVADAASDKLVTEAAVWNTLAWEEVGSTAEPASLPAGE